VRPRTTAEARAYHKQNRDRINALRRASYAATRDGAYQSRPHRLDWKDVLASARPIVDSYDTGVTLRQLFYQLVSKQIIPNTPTTYQTLSDRTAAARRLGTSPLWSRAAA
jgi:hypothetical protein